MAHNSNASCTHHLWTSPAAALLRFRLLTTAMGTSLKTDRCYSYWKMQEDAKEMIFFPANTSETLIHQWVLTSNYRCGRKVGKECLKLLRLTWVEAFNLLRLVWQVSTNRDASSVKKPGAWNLLFSPCSQIAQRKPIGFHWNYQGLGRDRAGNMRGGTGDFVLQHIFWKLLIQNGVTGEGNLLWLITHNKILQKMQEH